MMLGYGGQTRLGRQGGQAQANLSFLPDQPTSIRTVRGRDAIGS
jgi:hypothetical protein